MDIVNNDNWVSIKLEKPQYYKPVIVHSKEHGVKCEWSRVSNGEEEYYVSLNTNLILEDITHWQPIPQAPSKRTSTGKCKRCGMPKHPVLGAICAAKDCIGKTESK